MCDGNVMPHAPREECERVVVVVVAQIPARVLPEIQRVKPGSDRCQKQQGTHDEVGTHHFSGAARRKDELAGESEIDRKSGDASGSHRERRMSRAQWDGRDQNSVDRIIREPAHGVRRQESKPLLKEASVLAGERECTICVPRGGHRTQERNDTAAEKIRAQEQCQGQRRSIDEKAQRPDDREANPRTLSRASETVSWATRHVREGSTGCSGPEDSSFSWLPVVPWSRCRESSRPRCYEKPEERSPLRESRSGISVPGPSQGK